MISVAMATYNGEKFILKQLESIKNQILPVDEVIICDDRSSDDTVKIVKKYIAENGLKNWKITVNDNNIGFCLNFYKAINMCSGDIIFLSDQDDVWLSEKTKVMCDIFDNHPNIAVLSSSYDIIDGDDNVRDDIKVRYMGGFDGKLKYISLDSLIGCSYIRGFATAFRKSIKEFIEPIDLKSMMAHDWLINSIGCIKGRSAIINTKLVHYRFHHDNVSLADMERKTFLGSGDKRISGLKESIKGHSYLISPLFPVNEEDYKNIKHQIRFENKRLQYLKRGNFFLWLSLLGDLKTYKRYYKSTLGGLRVWLGDFCYANNINFKI